MAKSSPGCCGRAPGLCLREEVFQHTRALLAVNQRRRSGGSRNSSRMPSDAFYEAVWQARNPQHMVLIKLLLFTGLRNIELAHVRRQDVELDHCHSNSHFDF